MDSLYHTALIWGLRGAGSLLFVCVCVLALYFVFHLAIAALYNAIALHVLA